MSRATNEQRHDRALGALLGVAMGDALGMPTQTLSREDIRETYGEITDFVAPVSGHPVSHGLSAAMITDDTEQTLLLADLVIASPQRFAEQDWARQLIDWERDVKRRGLHDLLGPSTKRALERLLNGAPASETGRSGDTNGAAMRISPVGIATPVEPLSGFVDRIEDTCRITHNTAVAIAAASAVAATISAGVGGASFNDAIPVALAAAREGESRGHDRGRFKVADRIAFALEIGANPSSAIADIANTIGDSVAAYESIPAAFGVARFAGGDAWRAGLLAANMGGDTDTIGAIAAGMAGACAGASSLPADKVSRLIAVNGLQLDSLVDGLLTLRRTRSARQTAMEHAL